MHEDRLKHILAEIAAKYPPLITLADAAEIGCAQPSTLYDWSSKGELDAFKIPGRPVLLDRDEFVRFIFQRAKK